MRVVDLASSKVGESVYSGCGKVVKAAILYLSADF